MSTGLFREVLFRLERGSARGRVVLVIEVRERGALIIEHIFFGSSKVTPLWAGLGVVDRNFLGRGIQLRLAGVAAMAPGVFGGRPQAAFHVGLFFPDLTRGIPVNMWIQGNHGVEFYRIFGEYGDSDPENFMALPYMRFISGVSAAFIVGPFHVSPGLELSVMHTRLPSEAVQHLPGGTTRKIAFGMKDGVSFISPATMTVIYDTRDSFVLPRRGVLIRLTGRLGGPMTGSSYNYLKMEGTFSIHRGSGRSTWSMLVYGGGSMGNVPLPERFYIGDLHDMISPRAMGLDLTTASGPNLFGTNASRFRWGNIAARTELRYDFSLHSDRSWIYRSSLFVKAGLVFLASTSELKYRTSSLWHSIPVDATFDLGFQLDTEFGVFTFSLGNVIGRIPVR